MPRGTSIDRSHTQLDALVLEGYVAGDLESVRDFFRERLPNAGFELREGDAEEHEAETDFAGHGVEGRLKLHDIAGCDGALTLAVAVKKP